MTRENTLEIFCLVFGPSPEKRSEQLTRLVPSEQYTFLTLYFNCKNKHEHFFACNRPVPNGP